MSEAIDSGEFRTISHGDLELRLSAPIAWEVRQGWEDGLYTCVLREGALATRLRERLNHGRGATPAGAVKSLERRLLRLAQRSDCPPLLASLVECIGPREHDSRAPVTEMLRLALIAQWLCIEERRGRVFGEVTIRQNPEAEALASAPCYRLDLVMLEPPLLGRPLRITAVEIKSSRADFSGDRKWRGYIGRADRLYIATLPGIVRGGELPDGVGLLELKHHPDALGFFEKVQPARDAEMTAPARTDLLYALATSDRLRDCGLELEQRARHAVDAYWSSARPIRKASLRSLGSETSTT